MSGTPHVDMLRSSLGRARGLGAAHKGSHEWWVTRLTSIALIPLTLWFIFSVIGLAGEPRAAVVAWLSAPFPMALMILLVLATFHHLQLGLQVVIEDYVHQDAAKLAAVLAVKAACALLGLACIVAVLKIGL